MPVFNSVAKGKVFLDRKNIVGGIPPHCASSLPVTPKVSNNKINMVQQGLPFNIYKLNRATDSTVSRPILGTGALSLGVKHST